MNQLTFLLVELVYLATFFSLFAFMIFLHYHLSLFLDVYFSVIGVRLVTSFFVLFCCSVGAEKD